MVPDILEELSALEHEQWVAWATNILENEEISIDRQLRWANYLVPYDELPEDVKEFDREWARKVITLLSDYGVDVLV